MAQYIDEEEKVARLYQLYEQKMYAVAYSILNNSWQAEDAVSESFIKIIKNLHKIRNVESDKTKKYIGRIIQHTAIDMYRKNQRENTVFTVVSEETQAQFPDVRNPVEEMLKTITDREKMDSLLEDIPEKYREVLTYRGIHEFSVRETAAILEISENLVRKRYERARNMLAKKLGEDQYEYKII